MLRQILFMCITIEIIEPCLDEYCNNILVDIAKFKSKRALLDIRSVRTTKKIREQLYMTADDDNLSMIRASKGLIEERPRIKITCLLLTVERERSALRESR